ncbi:MAG TPA: peptidoglycan recognition family protein [Ktedonobacteraceae bacterium]|nr:peptidoglycan recognition family protein [Ktedonobacteraceae bacterium]
MLPEFEAAYWEKRFRLPNWYEQLADELRRFVFTVVHDDAQLKAWRQRVYGLAGEMLERGEIPLAIAGPDLDAERVPPDTLVLHHTEEDPDIPLARLNAIGFLRQYGFQYLENNVLGRAVRGEPVWSGHFRQGRMVFFAYHWLIRPDGTCERLLADEALGWHAGNWEINTRSIGIALSGNYEHATPPASQLEATARLIRTHYPSIASSRIRGHCEIRPELTCPGDHFLSTWKTPLLLALSR